MSNDTTAAGLPLAGIRVIEFSHMVMGPSCGMVLADLGADVIKVERPGGDPTRQRPGSAVWNRGKKSVTVDAVVSTTSTFAASCRMS